MIIVWGTKVQRRRVGHVADLCPACSDVTAQRLVQLRKTPHVYYLSLGSGKVAGYQTECGTCKFKQPTDPARYAARLDKPVDLQKLIELTNPGVYAEREEQKEREERAQRGDLSPEERLFVMQEALYPVIVSVEERAATSPIDARTALCFVAMVALPWFLVLPGTAAQSDSGQLLVYAGIGVGILGLVATIHAGCTRLPRWIRRTQAERIRKILQPYQPSPAELDQLRSGLRDAGAALGKHASPAWLKEILRPTGAVSGRPPGAR